MDRFKTTTKVIAKQHTITTNTITITISNVFDVSWDSDAAAVSDSVGLVVGFDEGLVVGFNEGLVVGDTVYIQCQCNINKIQ